MLDNNNPSVNVQELMSKVNLEVAGRHMPRRGWDGEISALPADAAATAASIESLLGMAEEKAQPRIRWSGRLNRFPFTQFPWLQRFFLKVLAFIFKDQRHVNFAILQALRESLAMSIRLAEQVDQLRARVNALDDTAKKFDGPSFRNGGSH